MSCSLHSANRLASPNVCGLRGAFDLGIAHTVNMAEEERNYLKAWRTKRGMSQDQLAERAGTTKAVISLLENEKRPLSSKWLRAFADILGTTPGYILDHDPNEISADIFDLWSRMDLGDQRKAASILTAFAKSGTDD